MGDREPLIRDPVVVKLVEVWRPVWALSYASSLLGWDARTYMPRKAAPERGVARAELSVLSRRLLLSREVKALLEVAEKRVELLNLYEAGVVRVLRREIDISEKLPEDFVYNFNKLVEEAASVWEQAKAKSDFKMFQPYLEKIVEMARKEAEYLGYEGHPYNALLDLYEEGLRIDDVDNMFNTIIPESKKVLEKVLSEGYYPQKHELERREYDKEKMREANVKILNLLGYPWERARMDVSAHPFTTKIGMYDVRITTWYPEIDGAPRDFKRSLYAVIHEFGHALYELQVDERLAMTPVASANSLGIHESQSRFWENIVGRSMEFTGLIKPILDETIGITKEYTVEELYKYFNIVTPSLIRVEADEVTYNMHIYLRYVIEKKLIEGSLSVSELPQVWNDMMEELLGVRPKNDREGVLQDVHWSLGSIGYFPTYSLGNVVSAQVKAALEKDLGELPDLISRGEEGIVEIKNWLREKIHKYGSTLKPRDIVKRATGEEYNPKYFVEYLYKKYVRR
ncbi:MAG: carboxypeptidase M32 [Desulfurococcales archaeon]|nr:carboxypeptidase M32 [Desulfurococcales archaeon]